MRKIALVAATAVLLSAGGALADDFNGWSSGEVFSGSAMDFSFTNSFDEAGITMGGMSAEGWNTGSANAGGHFGNNGFDGYAESANFGGIDAGNFGAGLGLDHRMDFNAASYGQSFGSVEWNLEQFTSW